MDRKELKRLAKETQPETGYFDQRGALKKLEAKWLDQLQPYGERGYNPTRDHK